MFEQLESRRVLSAVFAGLDLTITGTSGDDDIQVTQGGTFLMVHENGRLTFSGNAQDRIFQIFIRTYGGNDRIKVDANINTTASTGAGNDFISGGAANDILYGGRGNDTILGNDGDDFLIGRAGRDLLKGGIGDDILDGFDGHRDKLLGGGGKDLARVDRRVDFGRGNENILRIDPNNASSRDHDAPVESPANSGNGLFIQDKSMGAGGLNMNYDTQFAGGGFNLLFKFPNITGKVFNWDFNAPQPEPEPATEPEPVV